MAGRSGKKSKDNFEKIKKEMAAKKQKAKAQQNPGITLKAGGKEVENTDKGKRVAKIENGIATVPETKEEEYPAKEDNHEGNNHLEHVVIFKLGEGEYGIDINNVREINRISEITRFPGAPPFIAGMVDLRGDIIPILNLRRLFSINDLDSYKASKFLVVEYGYKRIGILIDSASEVLRLSKACLEEAPEIFKGDVHEGYINKVAKFNGGKRMVLILNLSRLLSFM